MATKEVLIDDPLVIVSKEIERPIVDADLDGATPVRLLQKLVAAGTNASPRLICLIELASFTSSEMELLLPLLWQFILANRDSNRRDVLIGIGAAIRKYVAIMPIERMKDLATLLEPNHRSPLPIELELEIAKMVYRNCEVHPPVGEDTQPELAARLWEMARDYLNPRFLLRDKGSAVASMAIEAVVAMRSSLAAEAFEKLKECPFVWFVELVSDDLDELHAKWGLKSPDAATWLAELRSGLFAKA
jgi:hypothetical protein